MKRTSERALPSSHVLRSDHFPHLLFLAQPLAVFLLLLRGLVVPRRDDEEEVEVQARSDEDADKDEAAARVLREGRPEDDEGQGEAEDDPHGGLDEEGDRKGLWEIRKIISHLDI